MSTFKGLIRSILLAIFGFLVLFQANAQDLLISGGNTVSTIICANGFVYTWGAGIGTSPVQVNFPTNDPYFVSIASGITVRAVDAGSGAHFTAVDCKGAAWGWGNNASYTGFTGVTGTGAGAAVPNPKRVLRGETPADANPLLAAYLTNVKYISGGNENSYAILNNGRAVGWGVNNKGQLGNGNNTNSTSPVYVRTPDGLPLEGVIQIESGDETGYALVDPDGDGLGTVYSWGANSGRFGGKGMLGRSGDGLTQTVAAPQTVDDFYARPVLKADGTPLTNIRIVSAGDAFCLALDGDGYVWAWGNGGWTGQTGQGAAVNDHSDPRIVVAGEWGTTAGAGMGQTLLRAKAIAAGQGFSMAVTIDGKPVAFGGNTPGNGGALGNGGTASSNIPVFIRRNATTIDNNVISISDGDAWGFYTTTDNRIFTWGDNSSGQLGIGNTTAQSYATEFTLPPCQFPAPKPTANITPRDFKVCLSWTGTLLNSQFVTSATLAPGYEINWYKDGSTTPIFTGNGITAATYTATTVGTYKVQVKYVGADAPCSPYVPAEDEIIITNDVAPFTANTGTYCGTTGTFSVTGYAGNLTNYQWFTNPTGGSALTITPATTPANTSNTITTLLTNATAVNATTYRLWVEDSWALDNNAAPTKPCATGSAEGAERTQTQFTAFGNYTLKSITMDVKSNGATGTATYKVSLYTDNAGVPGTLVTSTATLSVPVSTTAITTQVPVNFNITGSVAGTKYWILIDKVSTSPAIEVAYYSCAGAFPYVDNSTKNQLQITQVRHDNSNTTSFGTLYNFNIVRGIYYSCGRIPVDITQDCPPCSKPTAVTITTPASTPVTICEGTAQNLIGSVTVGAAAQNTNFYYSWRKVLPTPVTTPVAPTVIAIPVSTATAIPTLALTGATTDAGTYVLRVEDGNAGNASCYTEATVVIVVNATTVPGVIATNETICTGGNPAAFTVTTAASGGTGTFAYQWERSIGGAAYADIATATNATYDEAALTNATALPVTYDYRRKVTSGVCPQVTSNAVRITVNPAVVAGAVGTDETVCSGGNPAAFTQTTAPTGGSGTYTYVWQSSTTSAIAGFTNITPAATNSTYDPPTGITQTTYYRRVDGSGSCTTVNTNVITVTVPAALVAGTVTGNQTICYNTVPTAFASTAAATGGNGTFTYQWQQSTTSGGVFTNIAGETNATYTPTVAMTVDRYYRRQVTSGTVATCNVAYTTEIHVTVSPNFVVGSIGGTQTVCQTTGDPTTLTSVTLPTGGQTAYTYQWKSGTTAGGPYPTTIAGATNATYNPPAGLTQTTYFVRDDISAGGCGTLTTNEITVTVTPTVVPSVVIATPSTTICSGESITFTATPTNGGTPTYQWRRNGTNIAAATNATYATTGAADTDIYTVVMTSTANCASPATATSNAITITVTSVVTPAVSITALPAGAICAGTSVTFTASPGNGGTGPTYQWKVNGSNIAGATNVTFASTTLANGNTVSVDMVSNSGCASTPNATSNVITMVVNPIPTPSVSASVLPSTTICSGATLTFTAAPTQGGAGPTYQWKLNGGNISGATNATYVTSTAANNDSYTVEMVSNALCAPATAVASTGIVITVNPILVPSVTISAATTPATTPTTICTNGSVTFTATPTNGGTAPTYQWYINGTAVGAASTNATFTTTALTLSTDQVEVRLLSNALCANPLLASASTSVIVNLGIGAGTIGSTQTICYNTIPAAITQTVAPTNIVGTPTYQWEASATASGTYTAIPGATNIDYTPTLAMTVGGFIRRVITDPGTPAPCNTATSNAVEIIVRPILVAGTVGADETICSGTAPATMNQVTAPTGGTGAYTYQWESDATSVFAPIAGATNSSYTSPAITTTTRFQRVETSGTCGSVTSNIVTKTVTAPEVVTVSINDPGQICASSGAVAFTASASSTGPGTLTYVWSKTNPLTGVVTTVGTNSPNYSYNPVTAEDDFVIKVIVTTSTGCNTGPGTSNLVTLDIVNAITPTVTITGNDVNCAGLMNTFSVTSTGGGTTPGPSYQWYIVPAGSPLNTLGNPVAGATNITFSTSTLANGERVRVDMTSSSTCLAAGLSNPFKSNEITMQIKPIPAPSIVEGNQTICSPNSFTFTGNVTAGNTYEWRQLPSNTVVGTGASLTIAQSGTYTLYEDNGTCNSTSQPVVLDIVQTPVANAGADMSLKEGEAGSLNGSGGSVYSWSPATYLNNASISNPNFTATQTITYTLTVSNTSGTTTCSTTDDVTVFVVKPIIVPNVITVNGDGSNDDWYLENIEGYPNVIIEIYNRWGNLVWKSQGYPKNWDGTNYRNGEVLADGTYFYIINLQSQVYPEPLTGWVQIMK